MWVTETGDQHLHLLRIIKILFNENNFIIMILYLQGKQWGSGGLPLSLLSSLPRREDIGK